MSDKVSNTSLACPGCGKVKPLVVDNEFCSKKCYDKAYALLRKIVGAVNSMEIMK